MPLAYAAYFRVLIFLVFATRHTPCLFSSGMRRRSRGSGFRETTMLYYSFVITIEHVWLYTRRERDGSSFVRGPAAIPSGARRVTGSVALKRTNSLDLAACVGYSHFDMYSVCCSRCQEPWSPVYLPNHAPSPVPTAQCRTILPPRASSDDGVYRVSVLQRRTSELKRS